MTACNVGIDEAVLSSADIIVFPQPASDRITVRCAACSTPATIQLIDGTGATVSTITNVRLGSTCVDMDLDGYAPGLYFLDLRSAGQRVTKRVLVVE